MAKEQRIEVSPGDAVLIVLADERGLRIDVRRETFGVMGTYPADAKEWTCTATLKADEWPDATFRIEEGQ